MRTYLLCFFLITAATVANAQVGLSSFYNINHATARIGGSSLEMPYDNSQELALSYWFRLPKKRVEFLPTIYSANALKGQQWWELGFQFKTNLYPFDFGTDCDCPTFGKQGPSLQKGFFVQLSPGVANHHLGKDGGGDATNKVAFTVGGGIGIDFGVTNLLTLTPLVSFRHTLTDFSDYVPTDENNSSVGNAKPRLTSLQLGLQAIFRFDKKRY